MNLPRRVVTLLLVSVLLSAGSGMYAYLALRGVSSRQENLRNQVDVLKAIGKIGNYFTYLSTLPSKITARPDRTDEYYSDLESMSKEVTTILDKHGKEFQGDLAGEWALYLDKLRQVLPKAGRKDLETQRDIDEVENDDHLQMTMLLDSAVKQEENETGEILRYIAKANRRILTSLALGLILGLLLAGEAYRETSQIRAQNLLVKRMAGTDSLTGLSNRRSFDDAFARAWEGKGPLSLVLFDIDHFKTYNDNFGHPEGDRLLKELARAMKERCPRHGTLARWGGEEFILLLPGSSVEAASTLAEDLRITVAGLHESSAEKLARPVTISLGVAEDLARSGKALELVERADKALYKAKQGGRNRWMISNS